MSLRISRSLLAQMRAIAAVDPAREVCGLLLGRGHDVEGMIEAQNVADDPHKHFEIDPLTLIRAKRDERAGKSRVIGCYHSHPTGVSRPSACDRDLAEPGSLWLIFAGDDVTAWQRGDTEFQQLRLEHR